MQRINILFLILFSWFCLWWFSLNSACSVSPARILYCSECNILLDIWLPCLLDEDWMFNIRVLQKSSYIFPVFPPQIQNIYCLLSAASKLNMCQLCQFTMLITLSNKIILWCRLEKRRQETGEDWAGEYPKIWIHFICLNRTSVSDYFSHSKILLE